MMTNGFDYAYAVSIAKINQALQSNLSGVDMPVAYRTTDPLAGTITLNGKLAPWQIVTGGQNTLLNLSVPFAEGVLSLEGGAITGSYDLSGVSVITQVSLGWLGPGSQQQAQGGGSATQLVFDPTDTSGDNNPGYVAAINILDPDGNLDTTAKGLIKAYMAAALVDNKSNLQYIFANINPRPENLASWLQPTKWLYYYMQAGAVDAMCFLCMMSDEAFPQPTFDSTALTAGSDCVLLVSQPQFFNHVVLPGVRAAFSGGSFGVGCSNEVCTVSNNGDFNVGSVAASSLRVTTSDQGNGLKIVASGGGPLKFLFGLADLPGASYSWGVTSQNPLKFAGGQIDFQNDPNPTITQDHEIKWYDWVLLAVTGITNVAGLVAAIYDAVKNFHDQAQNVGVGTINKNVQAATGGAVINLQNIVDWKLGREQLSVTEAGLSGALYARGNFS